jgi:hypothetical protein
MRASLSVVFVVLFLVSCQVEEEKYTARSVTYSLFQSSDFPYEGTASVRELQSGELEVELILTGATSREQYFFPTHLHFGSYEEADAVIATVLNPIDIRTLRSTTVLGTLSDGSTLQFEDFTGFDGHIKIHLAEDGPDYSIILASGNVGKNPNSPELFDRSKVAVCTLTFPN